MTAPIKPKSDPLGLPSRIKDFNAREEFARVRKLLGSNINGFDLSLLIDYAETHGEVIRLKSVVTNEGEVFTSSKGGTYLNPMVNLYLNKVGHLAALRRDLFFTPKSRSDKAKVKSKATSILASLERE